MPGLGDAGDRQFGTGGQQLSGVGCSSSSVRAFRPCCISGAAMHRPAATRRIIGVWTSASTCSSTGPSVRDPGGGVLVVVGLVLLRFLMATTSEVGRMVPGAGECRRPCHPRRRATTAGQLGLHRLPVREHAARFALLSRLRAARSTWQSRSHRIDRSSPSARTGSASSSDPPSASDRQGRLIVIFDPTFENVRSMSYSTRWSWPDPSPTRDLPHSFQVPDRGRPASSMTTASWCRRPAPSATCRGSCSGGSAARRGWRPCARSCRSRGRPRGTARRSVP